MHLRINFHSSGEYTVDRRVGQEKWEPIDNNFYDSEEEAEVALNTWVLRGKKRTVKEVRSEDVLRSVSFEP